MMKKNLLCLGFLVFAFSLQVFSTPPTNKQWKLKFEDDFDGTALNTQKWSSGFGWGSSSGSFGEITRPQNTTVADGIATLKIEKEGSTYYAGAINTRNKMTQKYGYVEVRAKISAHVRGILPAFWQKLNNDMWPPEVDIFEYFGTQTTQSKTIHYKDGSNTNRSSELKTNIGNATSDYHIYGLEFGETYLRWYTDNKLVREITSTSFPHFFTQWSSDKSYSMLNIHANKNYIWLGLPIDDASLPVYMYIDYFRMYEPDLNSAVDDVYASAPRFYPNPASSEIHFDYNESTALQCKIYDIRGVELINKTIGLNSKTIDLNGLIDGVYFIQIRHENKSNTQKLIIKR